MESAVQLNPTRKELTEAELLKYFKNLTRQQKINAVKFGLLSDGHIREIRAMITRAKNYPAYQKRAVFIKILDDFLSCAQFTGFHLFHEENKKEANNAYPSWQKAKEWILTM